MNSSYYWFFTLEIKALDRNERCYDFIYLLYQLLLKILVFVVSYFEYVMLFVLYHRLQQMQQQQLINIRYQYLKISQKKLFINKVRKHLPVLNALPEPVSTITRHSFSMFNCSKHIFNSLKKQNNTILVSIH